MSVVIRSMRQEQWPQVAQLIHDSTNAWYTRRGFPEIFSCGPESTLLFCQVYEALDPGCCLIAQESSSEAIVGSCFYHPRSTHVSLGIMNVDPACFGQGVATRLLRAICDIADERNLPTRLVSSALNLDSFSLYNRQGFIPHSVYQDMIVAVPSNGMVGAPALSERVRAAVPGDVESMAALEQQHLGIERSRDFEFFLANAQGIWGSWVIENDTGELTGFMHAVRHPASNMVGPGFATSEAALTALIYAALEHHRGNRAVVLVPTSASSVSQAVYSWGGKNCEIHLGQVRGPCPAAKGFSIPTFMPETA